MLKVLLLNIFLVGVLQAQSINIAVAANVSYAIDALKKEFNKSYPDARVKVTLGSSGKLTAQIKHSAPYDIFMSANMKYPDALYKDAIAITKPVVYAQGSLAILSNKNKNFSKGFASLKSSDIKRVAIANPKTAPYGKATVEALKNGNIYEDVKQKLLYGESISQTVSYSVTAADVGFVAKSSLFSPKMARYKKNKNWFDVDRTLYTPINQGIVMLKKSKNNPQAKAFYDFILGDKAKKILEDFGYLIP